MLWYLQQLVYIVFEHLIHKSAFFKLLNMPIFYRMNKKGILRGTEIYG